MSTSGASQRWLRKPNVVAVPPLALVLSFELLMCQVGGALEPKLVKRVAVTVSNGPR